MTDDCATEPTDACSDALLTVQLVETGWLSHIYRHVMPGTRLTADQYVSVSSDSDCIASLLLCSSSGSQAKH